MNNNSSKLSKKNASDPTTRNYAKQVKNKANEDSPYEENEPFHRTTFK